MHPRSSRSKAGTECWGVELALDGDADADAGGRAFIVKAGGGWWGGEKRPRRTSIVNPRNQFPRMHAPSPPATTNPNLPIGSLQRGWSGPHLAASDKPMKRRLVHESPPCNPASLNTSSLSRNFPLCNVPRTCVPRPTPIGASPRGGGKSNRVSGSQTRPRMSAPDYAFGGCLCTHLRYRLLSCPSCKKSGACLAGTYLHLPLSALTWGTRTTTATNTINESTYKEYRDLTSGVIRGFCAWCGGSLLVRRDQEGDDGVVKIAAGSLDEPAVVLEGVVVGRECCGSRF
ncbi:hypothetical protein FN846DRAFT_502004 [Sphaerosporella brunnea]|uniref:CENP-V/GFA domain-containing protein n=1 Tax=Sphaerosporella brunnea TaxID=1250544 RepID=A0A5J5EF38_9PEZI|nr:hypothetical protein FN846DRAFT_502004 [Sphaerosporella brunnea]